MNELEQLRTENKQLQEANEVLRQKIKNLEKTISKLVLAATLDPLTGLVNRRSIIFLLKKEISYSCRTSSPLSCLFLDIDRFKWINDKFGHSFGDEVLRKVSKCFLKNVRAYDNVGRYGGEEFLITLRGANLLMAEIVAKRLRLRVKEIEWETEKGLKKIQITISIGVAELKENEDAISLIARADKAMLKAKHEGRDRIALSQ